MPAGARLGFDRPGLLYALRMSAAAQLAFTLAALLHVGNAYWAAMPVWVVAQASRGLLLERGAFRIAGTLIGAAAGLALPHLTADPQLQILLLGLWIAGCTALTPMLAGMRGYATTMAGMTAAVVVLPSLLDPDHAPQLALARVACTLIGVVTVIAVTAAFTPRAALSTFYGRVRRLAADAVEAAALAVGGADDATLDAAERAALHESAAVEAAAALVAAGSVEGYRRLRHVHALVGAALAAMAAARALRGARWQALRTPALAQQLTGLAAALRAAPGKPLAVELPVGSPDQPPGRLGQAVRELVAAEAALRAPAAGQGGTAQSYLAPARTYLAPARTYLAPARPWPRALRAGAVSGLATTATALFALSSGWPAGELVALGVCIFSIVLGMVPAPKRMAPNMLLGVSAGVLAAVAYRLLLQPHVAGLAGLVLSVAPFIVAGALARAHPLTALPALDFNMCFMLASQAGMPAAAAAEIGWGAAALIAGAALVTVPVMLLPDPEQRRPRASAAALARDLARLREMPVHGPADFHPRTTRRLLRLLADLQQAGRRGDAPPGLLGAINLGYALMALKELPGRRDLDDATRQAALAALARLDAMATAPDEVAARLLDDARAAGDGELGGVLQDLAAAIRDAAPLLRWTATAR